MDGLRDIPGIGGERRFLELRYHLPTRECAEGAAIARVGLILGVKPCQVCEVRTVSYLVVKVPRLVPYDDAVLRAGIARYRDVLDHRAGRLTVLRQVRLIVALHVVVSDLHVAVVHYGSRRRYRSNLHLFVLVPVRLPQLGVSRPRPCLDGLLELLVFQAEPHLRLILVE